MFTCSEEVYKAYVEDHPKAEPYLNKPIDMYEDLLLVCGDNQATNTDENHLSDVSDGLESIDLTSTLGVEDITITENNEKFTQILDVPKARPHGKRQRVADEFSEKLEKLADRVSDVAVALKANVKQDYATLLFLEMNKLDGFDELQLEAAFDHLNGNVIARSFLSKGYVGGG